MVGQPGHHAGGVPLTAALARLSGLPTIIVIGREHCESRFQVFQLLGKAISEPIQPFEEQPLRSIEPLDVARVYRLFLVVPYPLDAGSLRTNHFGRRVVHVGVLVFLDDRAVFDVGAKGQIDRFGVGRESVRADLDDGSIAAELVGVVVGLKWFWEDQPARYVHHKTSGVVGRSLADQERRHELRFLVDARPKVNVSLVATFGPLGRGET